MVLELGGAKRDEGMLCPHCHVGLAMATRANIEIDYCPKCRGVWLDRGELDKIIERSVAEATPAPAPIAQPRRTRDDDDDRDYDKRRKKKRRKSWIEEIFDELT